ncbi:MAG: hypothetical protein OSB62_07265 [Alphaproteobacteria bacterium]|nr:hypothetical protein [Alphaproteobacteria bacterium]
MKQWLKNIFILMTLVSPVIAQAVPCSMDMNTPSSQMETPCPNHQNMTKAEISKPCDGVMSIADCFDADGMALSDTPTFKLPQPDTGMDALYTISLVMQDGLMHKKARAPPVIHSDKQLTLLSLLRTTQRFRI